MTDLARPAGPTTTAGSIATTVDGVAVTLPADGGRALADVLRGDLGRYGTHLGCRNGDCGACTVLVDGEPYKSCLVPVGRVAGREVETLEGLDGPDGLHPVQEQFLAAGAFQCGFCLAGQVLCTVAALRREPVPEDLDAELDGNLCRCTGYQQISVAVAAARDRVRAATGD